ncbi:MAG: hypothetical protein JSS10_07625 [Verrucomicrobia bacterium]|nr:hypothetical protein [Verrucomicrobiota bacterium]
MAAKPVSASTPTLLELCQDEISLKPLADAALLNCGCTYNEETAMALQKYQLPCIGHDRVPNYYDIEKRLRAIVHTILENTLSFSGKELIPTNVSTEIPEAAKSLYEKGKILFRKQLFTEAAIAFLGATLHYPSYTEAQNSFASALKFIPHPSSGPQIFSSDLPMPGTTSPSATKPPRTNPEPTPAAAAVSLQTPAPAPVYHIDKLNTGTIVHNNTTTYAPRVKYAPVTQATDARRVVDKSQHIYAPQTTYAPANYNNTSYHITYGAPSSSAGGAPAAAVPPQNKPAAPELPAYVRNAKTPEGRGKALIKAIDRKERDMVDLLLEHKDGIKLDVQDEKYRTPLQAACEGNLTEVLELLIENGAKTDGGDAINSLIAAAKAQHREVVKILARHNTPLFAGTLSEYPSYNYSPCEVFEAAARNGDIELITFFLEEMHVSLETVVRYYHARNNDAVNSVALIAVSLGESALDIACEIQSPSLVQLLLSKGAKVNKALLITTEKRNLPILKLLCSQKKALNCYAWESSSCNLTLKDERRPYSIYKATYADLALIQACKRADMEFAQLLVNTTDLTKTFRIEASYQQYVYVSLGEIAFQASSKQAIKDLFPAAVRTNHLSY